MIGIDLSTRDAQLILEYVLVQNGRWTAADHDEFPRVRERLVRKLIDAGVRPRARVANGRE